MTSPVIDDTAERQLTVSIEGATAKLEYVLQNGRLLLLHTEVPEAFRGRGVGGQLVQAALDKAGQDNLTIVPWCPYARRWLKEHSERIGEVTVGFKTPPPRQ